MKFHEIDSHSIINDSFSYNLTHLFKYNMPYYRKIKKSERKSLLFLME